MERREGWGGDSGSRFARHILARPTRRTAPGASPGTHHDKGIRGGDAGARGRAPRAVCVRHAAATVAEGVAARRDCGAGRTAWRVRCASVHARLMALRPMPATSGSPSPGVHAPPGRERGASRVPRCDPAAAAAAARTHLDSPPPLKQVTRRRPRRATLATPRTGASRGRTSSLRRGKRCNWPPATQQRPAGCRRRRRRRTLRPAATPPRRARAGWPLASTVCAAAPREASAPPQ
jgi:hypothetical protein